MTAAGTGAHPERDPRAALGVPGAQMMPIPRQVITAADLWLDAAVSVDYRDQPLAQDWARVGKVIEELGEAITALIGATGQNPRKGVTHGPAEVLGELADTAITAVLGMQHFTKDADVTAAHLAAAADKIGRRAAAAGFPADDPEGVA